MQQRPRYQLAMTPLLAAALAAMSGAFATAASLKSAPELLTPAHRDRGLRPVVGHGVHRQGGYQRKFPHTAADFAALDHAQAKRDRKRAGRLAQLARIHGLPWRRAA